MIPPAPESEPDALRAALEAAGARCTPQRRAVYEALARAEDHPTADEIFRAARRTVPSLSLATVYNALEALEAGGLVARLPATGDGPDRFDARRDGHYHLRCLRSGRVEDLPTPFDPDLIARLDPGLADRLRARGFHATGYRLELVGYYEGSGPRAAGDGDE